MDTRYIFQQKYILFPVEDVTGNLFRWWLTSFSETRALKCFTSQIGDLDEIRKHINKIDEYILRFEQTFADKIDTPVKMYTDEAHNYTGIKTLQTGHRYEVVHVRHNGYGGAGYLHNVIMVDEFSLKELNELVNNFGYASFSDFLEERDIEPTDVIIGTNVDYNCEGWFKIAYEIAAFVAESEDGRVMESARADRLAARFGIPAEGRADA